MLDVRFLFLSLKAEVSNVGHVKPGTRITVEITLTRGLIAMRLKYVSTAKTHLVGSSKQIAEDCCLTIVGSLVTSGSKLGLALDQNAESQFWCMKSDGRIYSKLKPNLVLDIKGKNDFCFLYYNVPFLN